MEIVTIECMNLHPHTKHKWREGFLWWRKRSCEGMTKEFYEKRTQKPPHKHFLRLHMYPEYPFINPDKVVGHCSGCGTWCSIDKEGFYEVLLGRAYYHMINEEHLEPVR